MKLAVQMVATPDRFVVVTLPIAALVIKDNGNWAEANNTMTLFGEFCVSLILPFYGTYFCYHKKISLRTKYCYREVLNLLNQSKREKHSLATMVSDSVSTR